ncbi:MAG: hypothetical protein QF411_02945 [Planctomycetota bacterium]|nr:hypothetical protein [Planctomycetota bacterium]
MAWPAPVMAFCVALLGTGLMIPAARRGGLIDRAASGEEFRKPRREPVALVGGMALALAALIGGWPGVGFAPLVDALQDGGMKAGLPWPPEVLAGGVAFAALLLGLLDDRLGQRETVSPNPQRLLPRCGGLLTTVPARLAAHMILGLGAGLAHGQVFLAEPGSALLWAGAGLLVGVSVATFDHADGLAAGLGALALWAPAPVLAAACLGFVPWNFSWRRRIFKPGTEASAAQQATAGRPPYSEAAPPAYLGNAGSSLLGAWILLTPAAWPALIVPVVDLVRVSHLRMMAGRRPWSGDRCHLGHRLLACGFTPLPVALMCAAATLPAVLTPILRPSSPLFLAGGLAASLGAYVFLLVISPRLAPDGSAE